MFKKISLLALGIIVGILIAAALKPNEFRVERSIVINAPAEKIFPLMNDMRAFSTWSPYEKLDPAMKRNYSGPANGVGAAYEWEGDKHVGHGRMEITHVTPPTSVVIKPEGPQKEMTTVTWAMFGPAPYMSKVMSLFFSMDSMVGTQFEEGLENLKQLAEK
jgi:uncharacterized protein YndB with AHSA1/START domain